MTRSKITIIATTNKTWMNPPKVYEETKPNIHRMIKRTAIVSSILLLRKRPSIGGDKTMNEQGKV